MSLFTALDSGTSGLQANSDDLSVIGDNIANASTIGFKQSRTDFEEQLSQSLIGGGGIGDGVSMNMVQQIITQGSLESTGNATDLALSGNGMFVVSGSQNGVTGDFYTRDGHQNGMQVQGYTADSTGAIGDSLGSLQVGNETSPAEPSTTVTMKGTLNPNAPVQTGVFDPTNPTANSSSSEPVTIYDSLGNAHQATVYFTQTSAGTATTGAQWDWHAVMAGSALTESAPPAANPSGVTIASGSLSFNSSGQLQSEGAASDAATNPPPATFQPVGAASQTLTFNLGDPITPTSPSTTVGTGVAGLTLTAPSSGSADAAFSFASADGSTAGTMSSVAVGTDGTITGTFSNGTQRVVGQVAVASFTAADRLERMGANLYMATPGSVQAGALGEASGATGGSDQSVSGSGAASIGVAGSGGRGTITSGSLEESNVDITTQFVSMISAQRDYEANSKTVTTADQMLSDLIQMKR